MILASHAIIGGALGRFFPNDPVAAFVVGFASHFAADAIPHWQYSLKSFIKDPNDKLKDDMRMSPAFIGDLLRIVLDCLSGFAVLFIAYYYFGNMSAGAWSSVFWGAVGGVLPDALQFLYFKTRWRGLRELQRFHMWIHGSSTLDDRPAIGIPFQAAIVIIVLVCSFLPRLIL